MSNTITIDANANTIESVCVYQADRADVKRCFGVKLAAGNNEIYIENLPVGVDSDSIRVEGFGNAVIVDVIHNPPSPRHAHDKPKDTTMQALQKEVDNLSAEVEILEGQVGILKRYSKTFTAEHADPKALATYFDTYQVATAEIYAKIEETRVNRRDAAREVSDYAKKVAAETEREKRLGVKVTVVAYAPEGGEVDLSLSYVVSGASWTPLYDLHTKVEDSKDGVSMAILAYQASIRQDTGEDWNNVTLTLSTAAPQTGSSIPILPTYRIGKPRPPPPAPARKAEIYEDEESDDDMGFGLFDDGPSYHSPAVRRRSVHQPVDDGPMVPNTATVAERATSSSFAINGKSTIRTNKKDKDQTHKVSIAILQLKGQLEWITIPKMRPTAFLRCQIKNTSEFILLDGPSSIFMDGSFVCKSQLSTVSPQEAFTISLGVDPAVRITYHDLQRKTKSSLGTIISGKNDVTSFSQTISVKNTRSNAVSPLYVKDQVPTSEDADFKVDVKEPKNLGVAKERKEASIGSGVKARWAFKDPGSKGTVEDDGVVEWICNVPAGKVVDLTLGWDVVAPVGKPWIRK